MATDLLVPLPLRVATQRFIAHRAEVEERVVPFESGNGVGVRKLGANLADRTCAVRSVCEFHSAEEGQVPNSDLEGR